MKWFYNMRIKTKLTMAFMLVISLFGMLSFFSILQLQKINEFTNEMGYRYIPNIRAAAELRSAALRIYSAGNDYARMQEDSSRRTELQRMVDLQFINARYTLIGMRTLAASDEEQDLLVKIEQAYTALEGIQKRAILLFDGGKNGEGRQVLDKEIAPLYETLVRLSARLVTINNGKSMQATEQSEELYDTVFGMNVVLVSASTLICIFFAVWIARMISLSLSKAVVLAKKVSEGNLTMLRKKRTEDETGQVMTALDVMNESLQHIVSRIRSGVEAIKHASDEIATGNLDMSERTAWQVNTLERVVDAIGELSDIVRDNSEGLKKANELAVSASEIAVEGGSAVQAVVQTMGSINDSSRKIVDIISVIDGIAFQTNILALNAAVEAARAGEQGRGFAVVASEVRTLAQRSAVAAKEIKELIDDSVEKVDMGSQLVAKAGATMDGVVQSISEVSHIVANIFNTAQTQSEGIASVNNELVGIGEDTQKNAILAEEAASATESLKIQAVQLDQVVSVFTLASDVPSKSISPRPGPPAKKIEK